MSLFEFGNLRFLRSHDTFNCTLHLYGMANSIEFTCCEDVKGGRQPRTIQAFIKWRSDWWWRPAASGGAGVGVEGLRLKGLVMARCSLKDSRCYCTQT